MKSLYTVASLVGSALILLLFPRVVLAEECSSKNDPALYQLLDQKKFSEAEDIAKKAVDRQPDVLQAHIDLAAVYIRWATKEVVEINEAALGLKPGESGTVQLTPELIEKGFKSKIVFDPALEQKAEKELRNIIAKWPEQSQSYYCLMELQQKAGKHSEFLKTLGLTASKFQKDTDKTIDELLRAIYYYVKEEGRPDLAAESYETALKTFPTSAKFLSSYGATQSRLGFVRNGQSYFLKAYKVDSSDPIIVRNLVEVSTLVKDFSAAEKFASQELKLEPNNTACYFDLAMIIMATNPKSSITAWDRYLAAHDKNPDNEIWAKAGKQIRDRVEVGMNNEDILYLAQQMISAKAYKYAVPLLAYLQKQDENEAAYSFIMAQAYDNGGYYDLAWEELINTDRILQKNKTQYDIDPMHIYFNLGRVGCAIHRDKESLYYLKIVEQKNSAYPNLQYMLGKVTYNNGDKIASMKYFSDCLKLDNNKTYAYYCQMNLDNLR
jgi:Tfp pilus assembly protein PilF